MTRFAVLWLCLVGAQSFAPPSAIRPRTSPLGTAARGAPGANPGRGPATASISLRAAPEDGEAAAEGDDKIAKKVAGRKKRVVGGYGLAAAGYAFFTATALIKYKFSVQAAFIAIGVLLPAGYAHILRGAAANDRLASDTYKRLNLALGAYALIALLAREMVTTFRPGWSLTCLVAFVNAVKGYGYGLKGWELKATPVVPELVGGAKHAAATLAKLPRSVAAAGYQAAALAFAAWKLRLLGDAGLISGLRGGRITVLTLAWRCKTLMLLAVSSLTLKDAADRDRLDGTTFVQLNYLNAIASAVMAAYYLGRSSSAYAPNQFLLAGGIALALNSAFCAFNGLSRGSK